MIVIINFKWNHKTQETMNRYIMHCSVLDIYLPCKYLASLPNNSGDTSS